MAEHKQPSLRKAVGRRLRDLRGRAGLSQEKLANLADVHRTYVGRLERGESGVTVDMLAAILTALGISLAEFFRSFTTPARPRTPRGRN